MDTQSFNAAEGKFSWVLQALTSACKNGLHVLNGVVIN